MLQEEQELRLLMHSKLQKILGLQEVLVRRWKTTDGGTTWTNISNDMDNIAISWLGQSKSNPDVLYAATGENWIGSLGDITGAGVYKSTNGGGNWVNVSTQDSEGYVDSKFSNVSRLLVDPDNSDIVVISTVGGGGSYIFKLLTEEILGHKQLPVFLGYSK